jgi:hypothetical protein
LIQTWVLSEFKNEFRCYITYVGSTVTLKSGTTSNLDYNAGNPDGGGTQLSYAKKHGTAEINTELDWPVY